MLFSYIIFFFPKLFSALVIDAKWITKSIFLRSSKLFLFVKSLIKNFKLSDIQANAILEIKLRQLAKLEQLKLQDEKDQLVSERDDIEKILKSKSRLKTLIKNELIEIKENFGEERRSPIIESTNAKVFSEEETIVTEPITVVLSKAGWIRSAKGHEINPTSLSYRGDDSLQDFARGKSNQLAVFLDSNGKAYSLSRIWSRLE